MNSEKYIGLDVHRATIVVAVMDSTGKLIMESILETEAATILQFFAGADGLFSVAAQSLTRSSRIRMGNQMQDVREAPNAAPLGGNLGTVQDAHWPWWPRL